MKNFLNKISHVTMKKGDKVIIVKLGEDYGSMGTIVEDDFMDYLRLNSINIIPREGYFMRRNY